MISTKILLTTILVLGCVNILIAQTMINKSSSPRRAYLRVGIEPATMITIGYQPKYEIQVLGRSLSTYAEWAVSAFMISMNNSELKMGGLLPVFEMDRLKITNNLNFSGGSVETSHFVSKKFAVADEVILGFYKTKWFFAATLEYEKILLNKIKHTDFYKETYYVDAQDGWYKGSGGMFQFGVEGGRTIKQMAEIYYEIKLPFTEKFNGYGGSPLHVNLGVGYQF